LSTFKDRNFIESRATSAEAKKALLEKFRAKMTQEDPQAEERRAARKAVVEAREARVAEREAAKRARLEQEAAEKAARLAKEAAEKAAREEAAHKAAAELEAKKRAEQAARDAARPRHVIRDFVEFAERRAAAGRN